MDNKHSTTNTYNKLSTTNTYNKLSTTSMYNETQKTILIHIGALCLLTGMATIPQIKRNLYSVQESEFIFQKDCSTRTKLLHGKIMSAVV